MQENVDIKMTEKETFLIDDLGQKKKCCHMQSYQRRSPDDTSKALKCPKLA